MNYSDKNYLQYKDSIQSLMDEEGYSKEAALKAVEVNEGVPERVRNIRSSQRTLRSFIQEWMDLNVAERNLTLVSKSGMHLITRGSTNAIMGIKGVNKSRLGQSIAAALIGNQFNKLELKKEINKPVVLCWVDTELNKEEFLTAKKRIMRLAGISEHDYNSFLPISLIAYSFETRLSYLNQIIEMVPEDFPDHHVVFLIDTISDFVRNYNDLEASGDLVQLLKTTTNKHDCTIITVIHEVYSAGAGSKAKGHLGSELERAISTQLRISRHYSFFKVEDLKNRNGKRLDRFFIDYCDETEGLKLVDEIYEKKVNGRPSSVGDEDLMIALKLLCYEKPMPKAELVTELSKQFDCSDKTVTNALKKLDNAISYEGLQYKLHRTGTAKSRFLQLKIESSNQAH